MMLAFDLEGTKHSTYVPLALLPQVGVVPIRRAPLSSCLQGSNAEIYPVDPLNIASVSLQIAPLNGIEAHVSLLAERC